MEITKENRIEMLLIPVAMKWYNDHKIVVMGDEISLVDDLDETAFISSFYREEEEWNSN